MTFALILALSMTACSNSSDEVTTAPAPKAGSAISFADTTDSAATVSWGAATDEATAAADLSYKLVRASTSEAIDTVGEANGMGGTTVMDWSADTTSYAVTGLAESMTYWFAVLVKNNAGTMSLYAPQSATLTGSLTSKYRFENNGNDSVGSYNLTASDSLTYSSSTKKEGSYSVRLTGSSYLYNTSTSIDVSSGTTVSAWINFSTDTNYNTIISLYNNSGSYYHSFGFDTTTDPMTRLILVDAANPKCTTSLASGTWYHVVFTVDTSKNVVMYVNGSVLADSDSTSNVVGTYISTITRIDVGSWGGYYTWDGYIDDLRIYNKVLSATEVAALYAAY